MDKTACYVFMVLMIGSLALLESVRAEPRAQIVNMTCSPQREHNSTLFVPNFIALMERISDVMRQFGWGTAEIGSGPDANYGLAQCYGDLSLTDCPLCYAEARTVLPQCYPFNGGRVFLDGCFMRSGNYSFYEEYLGPNDMVVCGNASREGLDFQASARRAVSHAVATALDNGGYAKAQVAVSGRNETAYVLVNCWRTLNRSSCQACFENASAAMLKCLPWSEGRALYTGCYLRYSNIDFLNKQPAKGSSRGTIIIIVVSTLSSLVVLAVLAATGVYIWKRRYIQKKRGSNDAEKWVKVLRDSNLNFKYSTLEKATGSFDEANKLGQGGFGTVYKGALPDGREIAVKRLFFNNRHRAADFYNEVNMISSVEHKNLVRLLGCSCSGPESLLVYEFLPNKSLDSFIFDSSRDQSHISTAIAGTLGYMAPEYLANGQLTEKADVYSFGVLLLEIITGKQNNRSKDTDYSDSIIATAWSHFQAGTAEEIYDPNIMLNDNSQWSDAKNQIYRVLHIGLLCTQEVRSLRPSMSKVLQMLTKKEEDLPAPTCPPFMDEKTMEFNDASENDSYPLYAGGDDSIATVGHSSFYPR
ncbi:hypothetical protein V6N12_069828 [Hibiscus sabdariffa]|uniref:Cysteine-rich receptor-like protein kinase 2 n=1 Tax=Hibiscus sabdariffa TaxID=183260 RepID=A0ABR2FFG0_9ROSI